MVFPLYLKYKIDSVIIYISYLITMLKSRFKEDFTLEIGIDEAGRGCLWGPLMAGAVVWLPEDQWTEEVRKLSEQIKDSKKISAKKRVVIAESIKRLSVKWGIGSVNAKDVDGFGATRANQIAFRRAINDVSIEGSKRLCIDGILPVESLLEGEECHTVIDGDNQYIAIAAASILAKVAHDEWVKEWCKNNSESAIKYDIESCKGYGTAKHRKAILEHGVLEEHRKLYLRKLIPTITVVRYQFED
jgi:ribonuclease HII